MSRKISDTNETQRKLVSPWFASPAVSRSISLKMIVSESVDQERELMMLLRWRDLVTS
jgi:hypothetical protein